MIEAKELSSAFYTVKILKMGSEAAKHEVIARLFMECEENFVAQFITKMGEDKFYSWMPSA
jgi:hypothetical protein